GDSSGNHDGGDLSLEGGAGHGSGSGGVINVTAGDGGTTGDGGDVTLASGTGNGSSHGGLFEIDAGYVQISADGTAIAGDLDLNSGGFLITGSHNVVGNCGDINIVAGGVSGTTTGGVPGGNIKIQGGNGVGA